MLPGRTMIVVAARHPPAAAWRTDPDWSDLAGIVALRNLPPEDSRAYLRARGIPEDQQPAALAFTHGHPLALALVADLLARGEQPTFSPDQAPDLVRMLLERFVQQVPSAAQRRALETKRCTLATRRCARRRERRSAGRMGGTTHRTASGQRGAG
jgi:hypothetical protein